MKQTYCPLVGTQYTEFAKCDAHCHDLALGIDQCDQENGLPGCVCLGGMVLNEDLSMCVPMDMCSCRDLIDPSLYHEPGKMILTRCKRW